MRLVLQDDQSCVNEISTSNMVHYDPLNQSLPNISKLFLLESVPSKNQHFCSTLGDGYGINRFFISS